MTALPKTTNDTLSRWAGPALVAVACAVMLVWQWRTGPNILVDFGRELYVPWRLAEGQVLYRDLAWFNGPLSAYFNALVFRVAGPGLLALKLVNTAVAAALFALLYRLMLLVGGRVSATAACVVVAAVCGFGDLSLNGNYNFITPYSHEMTHGVTLALLAIWFAARFGTSRALVDAAGAGGALGLTFLTKGEVFLAAAVATAAVIGMILWAAPAGERRVAAVLGVFIASAVLPAAAAFALLSTAMDPSRAMASVVGTWRWIGNGDLTALPFYRHAMGVDAPWTNLGAMLAWTLWIALLFAPAAVAAHELRGDGRLRAWAPWAAFVVAAVGLGWWRDAVSWGRVPRPLPLAMAVVAGVSLAGWLKHRDDVRRVVRVGLALFALVLLLKMVLSASLTLYGFALAMPALAVAVVAVVGWVPDWIDGRGGCGALFRSFALGALLVFTALHLEFKVKASSDMTYRVAEGRDLIVADPRGELIDALLGYMEEKLPPDATLAVFPEGVMINYLARRTNPTRYINFMPPELIMFGEDEILKAYREHRPDYIALVHKDTSEYGSRFFGRDYGQRLGAWIRSEYEPEVQIGQPPLESQYFGILLMRSKRLDHGE